MDSLEMLVAWNFNHYIYIYYIYIYIYTWPLTSYHTNKQSKMDTAGEVRTIS